MSHAPGAIVHARGREWLVLPESDGDWLLLRPLGGTDREVAGVYVPLEGEDVRPAAFDLPDPARPGDFRSGRLLRDAARLTVRAGAGPFRCFGRVAVEPRPYQLVPLLMALKLDPVRLLIADDVGVGKTVEAGLVARELLDRAEARRLAVLCPPHLAEQWQAELVQKFHLAAEVVLPSTAARLERGALAGQSLFDLHPHVVVSTDYIKSERRRDEFVRDCPDLVLVDEAHTCASGNERGPRQLRHELLKRLAADPHRHLVLVTATPHSGNEGAFRSLLALLKPELGASADDLSGAANEGHRRALAAHFVQRRRADVRAYLDADTPFPERAEAELTYRLTNDYRKLLTEVLAYARERVADTSGGGFQQRVRWWSALALLRSVASSPAAAAATLRSRSGAPAEGDAADADALGEAAVLDLDEAGAGEFPDAPPGAQEDGVAPPARERLLRLARAAEALAGPRQDAKLATAIRAVRELVEAGAQPILFCRFIPTAEYVAAELRRALPKDVEVAAVTGLLPPAEREARVAALAEQARRVLVATDCLSEGINLQGHFDAVLHYDLSWNPTRHEQREGRVDRYGQPAPLVRTVMLYGADNQIDGLVLDVLLRKHQAIRRTLGVSVPLPANTSAVVQALMHGLLLRGAPADAAQLALFDVAGESYERLHERWDQVAAREGKSRTLFAQHALDVAEVAREWQAARAAVGSHVDVARFVTEALLRQGGTVERRGEDWRLTLPPSVALRDNLPGLPAELTVRFELPVPEGVIHVPRTHPLVEGLAGYVLDSALDPLAEGVARRCGAIRTAAVDKRTTLLLLRFRHHLIRRAGTAETRLLAEECRLAAFRGAPEAAEWLPEAEAELLLAAEPSANIAPQQAEGFVARVVAGYAVLAPALAALAEARAAELAAAHQRVRAASRQTGLRLTVEPNLPPDLLGVYVLLPA